MLRWRDCKVQWEYGCLQMFAVWMTIALYGQDSLHSISIRFVDNSLYTHASPCQPAMILEGGCSFCNELRSSDPTFCWKLPWVNTIPPLWPMTTDRQAKCHLLTYNHPRCRTPLGVPRMSHWREIHPSHHWMSILFLKYTLSFGASSKSRMIVSDNPFLRCWAVFWGIH